MEKQRTKIKNTKKRTRPLTEVERLIKSLLADGAIEISPEEMKKEPYVTYMKDIKRNGKFICD